MLALRLTLRPDEGGEFADRAAADRVRDVPWWTTTLAAARQADAGTVPGRAAIVSAVLSGPDALTAQEQRRASRQAARTARVAPRRALDGNATVLAVIAAVTVLVPWGVGHLWWRRKLVETTVAPPRDLRALPTGHTFVPEYVFGLLVVAGVLGLVLVRPPWRGRVVSLLAGLVLIGGGLASQRAANAIADAYNRAGVHAYASGPVPTKVIGTVCGGDVWTSTTPVAGVRWRYTLVSHDGECGRMVGYAGWHRVWRRDAAGADSFADLASSGGTLVVREVRQSAPNRLLAVAEHTGHVQWRWSCPGGQNVISVTYHGVNDHSDYSSDAKFIEADCEGTTYRVTYAGHGRRR
jgi:hypothetical protein